MVQVHNLPRRERGTVLPTSGTVTVTPIAAGTYRGEVVVPRAGVWEVQVGLPLSRFENPVTTVRLTVRP